MFRVNRFAVAMDITAAGTNAPMARAANANPANHDGKVALISAGIEPLLPKPASGLTFAAMALRQVGKTPQSDRTSLRQGVAIRCFSEVVAHFKRSMQTG